MKIREIITYFIIGSICISGCCRNPPKSERLESECNLEIKLSQNEFHTWNDVEFEFIHSADEIYVMRKPFFGMIVKRPDDVSQGVYDSIEINDGNFDLSPYPLFLGLVVSAWDNIARIEKCKGGSKNHIVDPGEYYIEVWYCTLDSCKPEDLCICRSDEFTILVEHGYGGVVDETSTK